jgi:exopolysaccharide biosynthesis polyprenyl glycosylphosphotransferase
MCAYKPLQKPLQWRLRPGERRLILIFGDLLVSLLAMWIALYFWAKGDTWLQFSWTFLKERPDFWFYLLPIVWMLMLADLYDVRNASRKDETLRGIAIAFGVSIGIYLLIFFLAGPNQLPRRGFAYFVVAVSILTLLWRLLYIQVFTAPMFTRRAIIVGAGRAGSTLAAIVRNIWPLTFFVVGMVDDDLQKIDTKIEGFPVVGSCKDLFDIAQKENVTDIIVAISNEISPHVFDALTASEERGIEVSTMPVIYEEILGRVPIFLLEPDWMLRSFFDEAHMGGFYEIAKRIMDFIGGLLGTLALAILFPIVALGILIDSGAPVFYTQKRLGKRGHLYDIIKFRTMRQDAEKDGKARPASQNDDRITRFGKFLRKSHIDEFPQFINVLRGDMSLVGPRAERPEIVEELQQQIPFYRGRLLVRPGVTGWAQVNYGYASNAEQNGIKLEYDLYYIKHRSLILDLLIMIRTIGTVVGFRGR